MAASVRCLSLEWPRVMVKRSGAKPLSEPSIPLSQDGVPSSLDWQAKQDISDKYRQASAYAADGATFFVKPTERRTRHPEKETAMATITIADDFLVTQVKLL